ncbi:hypothetical protein DXG01_003886 [Tephrocybe rancida]|nr:hypothetical protein DXG01_003886 [Tephrocybe rancida]
MDLSDSLLKGALVHFSEAKVSNMTPPTTVPWIAMVSCDFNATNASQEEDVFTLARDKGAVAALLYSDYSLACVINPEYDDPETFDQVFDIFSTQSLTSASLIQYQFGQFGRPNESLYVYDSQRLNDSAAVMNTTMQEGTPPVPGYLFAILQAYNSTIKLDNPSTINGSSDMSPPKKQNTNLAMAIRHPERYGPRARGRGGLGQSRARGLTRAILETFPVVKFSDDHAAPNSSAELEAQTSVKNSGEQGQPISPHVDWKRQRLSEHTNGRDTFELEEGMVIEAAEDTDATEPSLTATHQLSPNGRTIPIRPSVQSTSTGEGSSRGLEKDTADVIPASIGRETCPICIMDFEEGDDLRLLPCEGKHRFHQACVDPWLLELSSSCPICREGTALVDFLALENMISGESARDHSDDDEDNGHPVLPPNTLNRFSRYLRFAKGRHRRRYEDDSHPSSTSPS